ncbi:hypothetical protein NKDENANG_02404 [Candidatus Entotheonellaceae bacterium PAL068K]
MTQTTRVIRLRPRSSAAGPGGSGCRVIDPALYPTLHDCEPRQRVRRHHPTTRSPHHLPASPAMPPGTPRARRRVVHQVQAWAGTPNAIVLGGATQLRTPYCVQFLEGTVAVVPGTNASTRPGCGAAAALRLACDDRVTSPGPAPVVDTTQKGMSVTRHHSALSG